MKAAYLLALLIAVTRTASAGPCVALDYQEMKEVPAADLVRQACAYRTAATESLNESIENLRPNVGGSAQRSQESFDQCSGQLERMQRVLASKGITGKLAEICERHKTLPGDPSRDSD